MGREVRKVPPNWVQPVWTKDDAPETRLIGQERPMHDQHYDDAKREWDDGLMAWEAGTHPDKKGRDYEWWNWTGAPPDRAYYRPWRDEEATWFQVWQTVSEGTPVSPAFATEEELIQYLAENGDFSDQNRDRNTVQRRMKGWGEERARAFVKAGWAPSMMISGGQLLDSKDIPLAMEKLKQAD